MIMLRITGLVLCCVDLFAALGRVETTSIMNVVECRGRELAAL